jgi:multiple sugar transport system permease protein
MNWRREGFLSKQFGRFTGYSILIGTTIILILPVFFLVAASFKQNSEYMTYPIQLFAKVPQWSNYQAVFTMTPFVKIAARTGILGITTAVITMITSSLAGYAFARFKVPGSGRLFSIVIAMLIVPGIVLLIPQFVMFARLKLTNSYWPWILGALGGSPYYIFFFRQYFMNFPKELEEAAEVDGCDPFRIYWQIFMPNAKPVIATVMIFAFNSVWSDYLMPLIYLNANKTLLGVAMATAFRDPKGNDLKTISMAGNVIYVLPLIIVFFFAQKHILKGVVTSGLKG